MKKALNKMNIMVTLMKKQIKNMILRAMKRICLIMKKMSIPSKMRNKVKMKVLKFRIVLSLIKMILMKILNTQNQMKIKMMIMMMIHKIICLLILMMTMNWILILKPFISKNKIFKMKIQIIKTLNQKNIIARVVKISF